MKIDESISLLIKDQGFIKREVEFLGGIVPHYIKEFKNGITIKLQPGGWKMIAITIYENDKEIGQLPLYGISSLDQFLGAIGTEPQVGLLISYIVYNSLSLDDHEASFNISDEDFDGLIEAINNIIGN